MHFHKKKNAFPLHGRSLEILGEGSSKILEAKYEAKLSFPWGGGTKQKPVGSVDIFWTEFSAEREYKTKTCGEYEYFLELHMVMGNDLDFSVFLLALYFSSAVAHYYAILYNFPFFSLSHQCPPPTCRVPTLWHPYPPCTPYTFLYSAE